MIEGLGLKGKFRIEKISPDGSFDCRYVPNTIVNVGKSQVAGLILNDVNVGSAFDWVAIGLGSSTIAGANTILGSEYLKYALSGTRVTTTVTNDTARLTGSIIANASKTINEAGIFNASGLNTGSMLARTTFAGLSVGSLDTINITWDIQVS